MVRYLRQTGLPYSLPYVARTLVSQVEVTRLLLELFKTRCDPAHVPDPQEREQAVGEVLEQVRTALDRVQGLDADRILRALLSAVQAVLRTNAYQRADDGEMPRHLSFKLDPALVVGMPEPAPAYEIWVYSPRVEGVHLRFGAVARGGLRWSDRREDFRTEVLGLVRAQVVKNAVIVPTGAKGGFVGKQLPDPAARPRRLVGGGHRLLPHLHHRPARRHRRPAHRGRRPRGRRAAGRRRPLRRRRPLPRRRRRQGDGDVLRHRQRDRDVEGLLAR